MDPPELTNFGSLVRFALELESMSASFYRTAAGLQPSESATQLLEELAIQHEARRGLLERTRQQKLNEMVLEPITGLDGKRYLFDGRLAYGGEIRDKAAVIEEVGARFYGESADVADSLLREAARTFRKLAEENRGNLARLREGFPS